MNNWNKYDLITMVEEIADNNRWISDEGQLSDMFDEEIAPMVIEEYGEDDTDAMNQAFNDWTDGLCRDGTIHEEQYNTYEYVGKYS